MILSRAKSFCCLLCTADQPWGPTQSLGVVGALMYPPPQCDAEVKNKWSCMYTSPYAFMACTGAVSPRRMELSTVQCNQNKVHCSLCGLPKSNRTVCCLPAVQSDTVIQPV